MIKLQIIYPMIMRTDELLFNPDDIGKKKFPIQGTTLETLWKSFTTIGKGFHVNVSMNRYYTDYIRLDAKDFANYWQLIAKIKELAEFYRIWEDS